MENDNNNQQPQEEEPQLIEREIEGVTVLPPPFIQDPITNETTIIQKEEAEPAKETRNEEGFLLKTIHCRLCDCKILTPKNAKLVEKQITLINKKQSNTAEDLKYMWFLPDMFQFENIAFTKDVNSTHKYLSCAECEQEVIGIHYIGSKENYVAHDRIIYK
ncbi:hypothetical protein DICPUDRAFT_150060 [Dictyostelium purpureum]|uniref:Mss4-like protein n=1 Tax=Dictyostelium purpureum TaxID=5786 RepID=F0ZFC8_DICPU|nr:uncharacterized protein DICPUDRAFT_150060 [Dictyostelium purpureum]EGC37362.1 hypothetical protein DICPUDRAFT_150060 [Dictyostelium purpureum]|eukprot:XP_003286103.1 hypothetical protein DICPUDRAFT_150060 [Dictyostelium purpureum]